MIVVVITGSRRWRDRRAVEASLLGADALIVGDCPTGADTMALETALAWDVMVAVYCADKRRATELRAQGVSVVEVSDWKTKDGRRNPSAGPKRNLAIADRAFAEREAGSEVRCVAFPLPDSVGTPDCIARLKMRGFDVITVAAAA